MKVLALVAMVAFSTGQSAVGSIAGSWAAEFSGRTFIRLELHTVDGAIAGGISLGNFGVDAQGAVNRADEARRNLTPIVDATLRGSTLTFLVKDGDDTDRFELHLLAAGGAELNVLLNEGDRQDLAASGIPLPKPIRLTKR